MLMNKTEADTTAIKRGVDLRELAGRYTALHRESTRESAGPCPRCSGTNRFHVTETSFMCRQCHATWGDVIEFVCWIDGVGFKDAINKLSRYAEGHNQCETAATSAVSYQLPTQQPPEWTRNAEFISNTAHNRLFSPAGHKGADYLLGRGLEPHTWQRFELGYRENVPLPCTWDKKTEKFVHPLQPAILIPWHDEAGQIKAIRYRFLEHHEYQDVNGRERREKLTAASGSQLAGQIYGWPGLLGGCERLLTLLTCEGELNALSSWQAQHDAGLDVLSLGSESQLLTPQMVARAQQYHRVIVWADRNDVAWQWQQKIPGAYAIKSPSRQDANDLLCRGNLDVHLAGIRYQAATTNEDKEGLLWDLYDSAKRASKVDAGRDASIRYIAQQLGKQISLRE